MEKRMEIIISNVTYGLPFPDTDSESDSDDDGVGGLLNRWTRKKKQATECFARHELMKKIGRINFTKFLQIMYSYNNINIAYSFGELKSILLYEKWNIIQKKSVYTLMLINKKKTNNYLPNEIMRLIVSYIKVDDNTDKVWINKNEAYQKYNNDIMKYEDLYSVKINMTRNIIEKYSEPNKDSISNKVYLSNPEYWNKKKVPEIRDIMKKFKSIPLQDCIAMGYPLYCCYDTKKYMINKLTKYIKKTISPQEFKLYYEKENIKFYNYHKEEANKNLTTIFSTTYWSSKPVKELRIIVRKQGFVAANRYFWDFTKPQTMQIIIRNLKKIGLLA